MLKRQITNSGHAVVHKSFSVLSCRIVNFSNINDLTDEHSSLCLT